MPAFRSSAVRVRVPATSANLGPGFDALGLALSLYDDVVAAISDEAVSTVDVEGEGKDGVPRDETHLVVKAMRAGFKAMGGQPRALALVCANRIPHGRGLGSSAAAICAGLLAARALTLGGEELLPDAVVLKLAAGLEGHPDNVAACLLGGLSIAWLDDSGVRATRLEPSPAVVPVAFIPAAELSTNGARKLLPATVSHADAAANAGRAALLIEALTRQPALLLPATEDRLHQGYRAPAMPESAALLDVLRGKGVPAVVSGSGPTVLALCPAQDAARLSELAGGGWRSEVLPVSTAGAAVVPLDWAG